MSVVPNTSRASVPAAWPTCRPNTAEPSRRSSCAGRRSRRGARRSRSAEPSPMASPSVPTSASDSDDATGSVSVRHVGSVASTHSARLQARGGAGRRREVGRGVEPQLGHARAPRAPGGVWAGVSDGSPSAAACWRARSCAICQFTGSSPEAASMRLHLREHLLQGSGVGRAGRRRRPWRPGRCRARAARGWPRRRRRRAWRAASAPTARPTVGAGDGGVVGTHGDLLRRWGRLRPR